MNEALTIGEVAKRSGVATSALRFYEEQGLIGSERNSSGHRRYPQAVIRRVAFIVFAQRIGLTLEEIGTALAKLPRDRVPERSDWAKLSGGWTKRIDERIAELQRLRPHRVYRLRLSVARPVSAREPGRPCRSLRSRSAVLDKCSALPVPTRDFGSEPDSQATPWCFPTRPMSAEESPEFSGAAAPEGRKRIA